jgi:CheY-like chemotaxis protein
MRALVVCRDAEIIRIFSQIFLEVGIETEKCGSESQAIDQLMSDKFEALVLDFDKLPDCPDVVRRVREIRPNKTAQVFAIASNDEATTRALESGSTFVLKRPPVPFQVRNLLHTVYGRMLRSLQAYFRLNIEFTVSIARALGRLLQCTTINISQQGWQSRLRSLFNPASRSTLSLWLRIRTLSSALKPLSSGTTGTEKLELGSSAPVLQHMHDSWSG